MTTIDQPRSIPVSLHLAPAVYGATLFASAFLLFLLQPMFAKMVLPRLGGAPSVWSVAMVFYQTALLAGYCYAHILNRLLSPPRAALVHFTLLGCAALTLPIGIAAGFDAPPSSGPGFWLFGLFAMSIGLPFMALSASAPMLQRWFAASGHVQAKNPYVLYAASNIGSFVALMAYPFAIEPLLPLRTQTMVWSLGFAALAVFIAFAGLFVARRLAPEQTAARNASKPAAKDRLLWIALSAIPSGLVIAVTAFISTDIAAAPFMWVVPLALFLLTFVAVFRERPWIDNDMMLRFVPIAVAPLAITLLGVFKPHWLVAISSNLLVFVILTLTCHGQLYRRRPAPAHLTEFYFFSSLGGVIGGAFAGLLAPYLFNNVYEYPLLILAGLLVAPWLYAMTAGGILRQIWPVLAAVAAILVARFVLDVRLPAAAGPAYKIAVVGLVILVMLLRQKPALVVSLTALGFLFNCAWTPGLNRVSLTRSFFGVHQVIDTADGEFRLLFHGTTVHGAMRLRDNEGRALTGRPEPLTYYYFGGPISEAVEMARNAHGLRRVAVVGLGSGSLACHRKDGESWTFYEIDPEVVRIAEDAASFRFISQCAPQAPVVLGDARLTLAAANTAYDLIVLDAFSSDSIPVHLLTREALQIYRAKLAPNGQIIVHISNRHLDLAPIVGAAAESVGLVPYFKRKNVDFVKTGYKTSSAVMLLTRSEKDLAAAPTEQGWSKENAPASAMWTDDFSNILGALVRDYLSKYSL
jgi:hypothetical protein